MIFIAARLIGDVGLGKYYTIAAVVALTNLFSDLGISTSFTKEVSIKKDQASKYFVNLFVVKLFLGCVTYISLVVITYLLNYSIDIMNAAYIYGIYMAFWAFSGLFLSLFQAFEEMKYSALLWGISGVINPIISVFLLYNGADFMSPVWGLTIGSVVSFIIGALIVKGQIKFSLSYLDWNFLKQNLKLAFPFAINSIFSSIYFRINSIILSKLVTEQVMGWFGSAFKMLDNLLILPQFFLGAVYPVLCRLYKESQQRFISILHESLRVIAIGAFPISIGLLVLSQKTILFLYGPAFVEGTISLEILSFALLAIFFTSFQVITLMSMGRMKVVNLVGGINIFLNSILSYVLISSWGVNLSLNGAALSTLICEVFGLVVFTIFFIKKGLFTKESFYLLIKPAIAGIIMGIVVYFIREGNILISVIIGIIVYFGILLIVKGISPKELAIVKDLFKKNALPKVENVE